MAKNPIVRAFAGLLIVGIVVVAVYVGVSTQALTASGQTAAGPVAKLGPSGTVFKKGASLTLPGYGVVIARRESRRE